MNKAQGDPADSLVIPDAIYIETSRLWDLPPNLDEAKFQNLRKLADDLHIPIYVVRLCVDEYLETRREQLPGKLDELRSLLEYVRDLFPKLPAFEVPDNKTTSSALEERFLAALDENGVEVVENAVLSQEHLVPLAVRHIRPFEKEDRGYKDTIILHSILEQRRRITTKEVLVIAKDEVFGHEDVKKTASDKGVRLHFVKSIEGAIGFLKKLLDAKELEKYEQRAARLREFLRTQASIIENAVRAKGDVNPYSFGLSSIEQVKSIKLKDVGDVLPGFLPSGEERGRMKAFFVAQTEIMVEGEPIPISSIFSGLSIRIGEIETRRRSSLRDLYIFPEVTQRQLVETTISPTFGMEASVDFDSATDQYSNLIIEDIIPARIITGAAAKKP